MSNPASDLHDLLTRWRAAIPSGGHLGSAVNPRAPEGAEEIRYFFDLISQVDRALLEFEVAGVPVGLYRRQLSEWVRIPLGMKNGWTTGSNAETLIPDAWVDQVEGVSLFLRDKTHRFPVERLEQLRAIMNEAIELLAEDRSLPSIVQKYIHDLLASIRLALSHQQVGLTFDYANAVRNLYVAFVAAEAKSSAHSSFWGDLGRKIVSDVGSHVAVSATTALTTLALTQM